MERTENFQYTYINDIPMVAPYRISPDPVENFFVIASAISLDEHIDLTIFSHEGLLFKKYDFILPNENYEFVVDIRTLPPGDYYLMIHSERGYKIERMTKNKKIAV